MRKSFTLIELLVVIAIIGLLSTVVLVSVGSVRAKARDANRIANVKELAKAIEIYYVENQAWPTNTLVTSNGWTADNFDVKMQPYMPNLPQDPLGGFYSLGVGIFPPGIGDCSNKFVVLAAIMEDSNNYRNDCNSPATAQSYVIILGS